MIESSLPQSMWTDALKFGVDIYNNSPTKGAEGFHAPVHLLQLPALTPSQVHPFGCSVYFLNTEPGMTKLSPRSEQGLMLGHLSGNDGWWVWDLKRRRAVKSRDVMFFDDKFPGFKSPADNSIISNHPQLMPWPDLSRNHTVLPDPTPQPPTDQQIPPVVEEAPPRPQRRRVRPERYGEYVSLARFKAAKYVEESDPKTFKQARKSKNWPEWFKAASKEMETLVGRETWKLVPRPARRHIIRSKWVFKTKRHVYRSID